MGYQEYDQSGYENYPEDSQMEGVTQKMEDVSSSNSSLRKDQRWSGTSFSNQYGRPVPE
jgi:hypothetical protein